MRLGTYPCQLIPGTRAYAAYANALHPTQLPEAGMLTIQERHRHRFEFNNEFRKNLGDAGLVFSGMSPDNRLVEITELRDHPFMLGSQFHPEFKSRPNRPHPLFRAFIDAAIQYGIGAPLFRQTFAQPQTTTI